MAAEIKAQFEGKWSSYKFENGDKLLEAMGKSFFFRLCLKIFLCTSHLGPGIARAFTRALRFEKLKAPLFPGPRGAGDTNDWCFM